MKLALLSATLLLGVAPFAAASVLDHQMRFDPTRIQLIERGADTEVILKGASRETAPGRPDLPVLSERIELPEGVRVARVEVLELETVLLATARRVAPAYRIAPGMGPLERTAPDPAIYGRKGFEREAVATLGYQGHQRGRNSAFLRIQPVLWDAADGRLERVDRLRVRLHLEPQSDAGLAQRQRVVREWEPQLEKVVASRWASKITSMDPPQDSPQQFMPTQLPSVLGSPVAYVIVTLDSLAPAFQALADWKTRAGVPAVVRSLSFIRQEYPAGADDADKIRRFIRDAYAQWGTLWVLLGGDTEAIPTRLARTSFYGGENIACDMYFSCLDGNWNADGDSVYGEGKTPQSDPDDACDLLPEVYVGRAPVTTIAQVNQFVTKTLQYQRTPTRDYENNILFFAEVLFPPDWQQGNPFSMDGADMAEECLPSIQTNPNMRFARLYQNYTWGGYQPGALLETKQAVLDSLDVGYNMAVHIGHGFRNVMSVGDEQLNNGDAMTLSNGNRLINLYASNCTSNAIDFPCIGEAFMHAAGGGAVTNIGSSRFDFPVVGRDYQREFFRLVFEDSMTALGEAQAEQKTGYATFAVFDNVDRWTQFTLLMLGDPELRLWTQRPRLLAATHPATMSASETTLTVNVTTAGLPLYGARVTAYKAGDEYRSALTNGAGNVTLDVRPDTPGTLLLTVTAFNCKPYEANITVNAPVAGALLAEQAMIFDDVDDDGPGGVVGNGNGILESGEVVDFRVPLKNNGTASAGGVTATLTESDAYATLVTPNNSYGSIGPGNTGNGIGWFRISTPYTAPDQHEIALTLSAVDAASRRHLETLRLTLKGPDPRHYGHSVVEISGGNGNSRPDVGETVDYTARLRNMGTGLADQVTAVLRKLDANSTVTDSTASFGNIATLAEVAGDPFSFSVLGAGAKFELRVSNVYGLLAAHPIDLTYPVTPSALGAQSSGNSIAVTWLHNAEPDIIGYNVYRSTVDVGPYNKVNLIPSDRTSYYRDENLVPLTRYYYKIAAVDSSGNESSQSGIVSQITSPPYHGSFPAEMNGNTPASVAVARVTEPGRMDIFAGAGWMYGWHSDGIPIRDADGSGTTSGDFSTLGNYFAAGPSIADLDGGGMEIIATTWTSQQAFVFDLNGDPKPGWPVSIPHTMWTGVAVGDLDGNGVRELAFGSNGGDFYVFRHDGTEWMDGDGMPGTIGVFKVVGSSFNYSTPALAPLEGGSQLDIIVGTRSGFLQAWRPNGTNVPGFPINIGAQISAAPAVGPLDGVGDPVLDIVIPAETFDSLYVFTATGARRPGFPVYLRTGGNSRTPSPALADMDNDGFLDIVVAGTNGRLYVYNRNGVLNPNFANVVYSTQANSASESSPVVADITGDGINDIVIGDEAASLNAFNGLGQQLPGFPIPLGGEVRGTPALCDCDGDGLSEIVLADWDMNLYMWDYDFAFSPNGLPPWPQFHHDAMRTGYALGPALVDVDPPATEAAPLAVEFGSPWPNPVSDQLRFRFAIPADRAGEKLGLAVFDLQGRRVREVASGISKSGRFSAEWDLRGADGSRVAAGIYFVALELGADRHTRRVVVVP